MKITERFLAQTSPMSERLHQLLWKNTEFVWDKPQKHARHVRTVIHTCHRGLFPMPPAHWLSLGLCACMLAGSMQFLFGASGAVAGSKLTGAVSDERRAARLLTLCGSANLAPRIELQVPLWQSWKAKTRGFVNRDLETQ